MNFKKLMSSLLIAGSLCMVGTGYAAWYFSEEATSAAEGNAAITTVTEDGSLTVDKQSFYLIIDQSWLGWSTVAYDATLDNKETKKVDEALEACKVAEITKLKLTYSGSKESVDETITFNVDITNNLSAYITVGDGSFDEDSINYVGEDIENCYNLPSVSWVEGMKPTNEPKHKAMVEAIGSDKVEFEFTTEVE